MHAETALSIIPEKAPLLFAAYPRLPVDCAVPAGWAAARLSETVDALVITSSNVPDKDIESILRQINDPFLPVVSLADDDRPLFDASAQGGTWQVWNRLEDIHARLQDLPDHVRYSQSPEAVLLGRLYSRSALLDAHYTPTLPELVSYPAAGLMRDVDVVANRLTDAGLLERKFFDRLHVCPDCRSSALSVREECHACRSPHLTEESIVHHFRCAHEASEDQFRNGGRFECPKCGDALRHIGLDYDKPGTVLMCRTCGARNDSCAIGFMCLHCGRHHDTEQMPTRDWYSYQLTAKGTRCLLDGTIVESEPGGEPNRFGVLLDYASREQAAFGVPFQLVHLRFTEAERIRRHSVRLWDQMQQLVHDGLHSALREVDSVMPVDDGVLILLPRSDENDALLAIAHIRQRTSEILKVDPGIECQTVSQSEVRHLLQGA